MTQGYRELIGFQSAVAEQWMAAVCSMIKSYAILLDPRPDLAAPARSVQSTYCWWW